MFSAHSILTIMFIILNTKETKSLALAYIRLFRPHFINSNISFIVALIIILDYKSLVKRNRLIFVHFFDLPDLLELLKQ